MPTAVWSEPRIPRPLSVALSDSELERIRRAMEADGCTSRFIRRALLDHAATFERRLAARRWSEQRRRAAEVDG